MPQNCCVPGCYNVKGGHIFPATDSLRKKWIVAVHRVDPKNKNKLWTPSMYSVVCSDHFKPEDYRPESLLGEKKRLWPSAVPSIFPLVPNSSCTPKSSQMRKERLASRNLKKEFEAASAVASVGDNNASNTSDAVPDMAQEITVSCNDEPTQAVSPETNATFQHQSTQCTLLSSKNNFTIDSFADNPKAVHYYTGFHSHRHFSLLFSILGECVHHLPVTECHLHPKDQLFLTLMKLRQARDDYDLSILFGLRPNIVSEVTLTWINFLYFQLKEINFYPSQQVVKDTMPDHFRHQFPSTRIIIDGTEIPIQKPSKVVAQQATFSTYKNRNTLKVLVGCTPRGLVSFVSPAYGGSTSDRQICERSELLLNPNMFEKGDSIMADRGFNVQDLFATKDVYINMPTMLRGKSQLSPEQVVRDRRVAAKRIHIERVIGLAKTFKILKKEIPGQRIVLGDRIIYVCFMLTNFKKAIVGKHA